jgi:tRNA pseudouridine38-40 synthase
VNTQELVRYSLLVQYDGAPFHGWQLQDGVSTVQGEIEKALLTLTGERRPVTGSGRTDRGVHALGQMAAVTLPSQWTASELLRALNAILPRAIWVEEARRVRCDFHPRYSATARSYVYQLGLLPMASSPFYGRWCWDTSREPPVRELLDRCAEMIPGDRSFVKFAKTGQPQRGERCHVFEAGWENWNGPGIAFRIRADRYLHHMVRYLVGSMVEVGRGGRGIEEMRELLENPGTSLVTSRPAPAHGLFLSHVEYSPESWEEVGVQANGEIAGAEW